MKYRRQYDGDGKEQWDRQTVRYYIRRLMRETARKLEEGNVFEEEVWYGEHEEAIARPEHFYDLDQDGYDSLTVVETGLI